MDAGTGDGRYPLFVARARSDTFVIGCDAATDALAYAARHAIRDRVPNLLLVAEPVECLPHELHGLADEVTVHFPWGSLLRGALAQDADVLGALASLPRAGGSLTLLLSLVERDGNGPALSAGDVPRLRREYAGHGLVLREWRAAMRADVVAARSSWGKRLDVGGARPGLLLRFVREARG